MKNMENKEQQAVFVLEKTEYVNNVKEYRILKNGRPYSELEEGLTEEEAIDIFDKRVLAYKGWETKQITIVKQEEI